jgi:hypothetical protein
MLMSVPNRQSMCSTAERKWRLYFQKLLFTAHFNISCHLCLGLLVVSSLQGGVHCAILNVLVSWSSVISSFHCNIRFSVHFREQSVDVELFSKSHLSAIIIIFLMVSTKIFAGRRIETRMHCHYEVI